MDKPRWVRAIDKRDIDSLIRSLTLETVNEFVMVSFSLWSPLQYACQRGFAEEVECLLKMGAQPNLKDTQGWTALHLAAINDIECVRLLLRAKANVKAETHSGQTPLSCAIDNCNKPMVRLLMAYGAKVKDCNPGALKWVMEIEREFKAAMILVGIQRFKRSPVLATNPLDITKLIAKEIKLLQRSA